MDNLELHSIAERIKKYKLEMPAKLFLEMHKPLGNIFKEASTVGAPFLALLFGNKAAKRFQYVCSDKSSMETLISYLEE